MKIILATAALLLVGAAPAQAQTREPSLTLYDQPGFKGKSVTLFADNLDLSDTGVVGTARSAQVFGRWRVCEAPGWRGRCQTLSRNIADLAALGIAGRVVSAALDGGYSRESYEPDPYAFDVEDYSGSTVPPPPVGWGALPLARPYAPARRPQTNPAPRTVPSGASGSRAAPVVRRPAPAPRVAVAPAAPAAPVVRRPAPAPRTPVVQAPPAYVQPTPAPTAPPAYGVPDYGGGPAFGPASR